MSDEELEDIKISIADNLDKLKGINLEYIDSLEKAVNNAAFNFLQQSDKLIEEKVRDVYKYLNKQDEDSIFFTIITSVLLGSLAGLAVRKIVGSFIKPMIGSQKLLLKETKIKVEIEKKQSLNFNNTQGLKDRTIELERELEIKFTQKIFLTKKSFFAAEAFEEGSASLAAFATQEIVNPKDKTHPLSKGSSGFIKISAITEIVSSGLESYRLANSFFDKMKNRVVLGYGIFKDPEYLEVLEKGLILLIKGGKDRNQTILKHKMRLVFEIWLWISTHGGVDNFGVLQNVLPEQEKLTEKDIVLEKFNETRRKVSRNLDIEKLEKRGLSGFSGENDHRFIDLNIFNLISAKRLGVRDYPKKIFNKVKDNKSVQVNWKIRNVFIDYLLNTLPFPPSEDTVSSKSKKRNKKRKEDSEKVVLANQGELTFKSEYLRRTKSGLAQINTTVGWFDKQNIEEFLEDQIRKNTEDFRKKIRMEMGKELFHYLVNMEKEIGKF